VAEAFSQLLVTADNGDLAPHCSIVAKRQVLSEPAI
jgi:hypothetical protein